MTEQRIRNNARPPNAAPRPADQFERLFGDGAGFAPAEPPMQAYTSDLLQDAEVNFVYRRLMELPSEIREAQQRVIEAEAKANAWKAIDLPRTAQDLDEATAGSTMAAMANGAVDGKNQAARDVQLANWLAEDTDVMEAQDELTMAKRRLAELEIAAETARADMARLTNEFYAVRASARLQAACLEALAGLATE